MNNNTGDTASEDATNIIKTILIIAFAIALLYIGGWTVMWETPLNSNKAFLIEKQGFAVRFNDYYYGASIVKRFFDSPALSWILLLISITITTGAKFMLLFPVGGGGGNRL